MGYITVQALKDQFRDERQKVDHVTKTCEQLTTAPHDDTNLHQSPTTDREARGSSVDLLESSVDASPTAKPATAQGEGLKELQEAVQSLEEKCTKVEEKLRAKGVILADRLTAVGNFDKDFNKFHKELDCVVDELSECQPVMNDDEAVKEQIEKTDVSGQVPLLCLNIFAMYSICLSVCLSVYCVCVCVCDCMRVCFVCVCVHMCVCLCMFVSVYVCLSSVSMYTVQYVLHCICNIYQDVTLLQILLS